MATHSLENPMDRRSLAGYSSWGCKESDTTEHTLLFIGNRGSAVIAATHLGMMVATTVLRSSFSETVKGMAVLIWCTFIIQQIF